MKTIAAIMWSLTALDIGQKLPEIGLDQKNGGKGPTDKAKNDPQVHYWYMARAVIARMTEVRKAKFFREWKHSAKGHMAPSSIKF